MSYARYLQAERTLNEGLIRVGLSREREHTAAPDPAARMLEMQRFLDECGNPQRGIPAVHVGGTSGKGSVCAMVAGILRAHGLSVGLHVTPYLQSATEKIWIDGHFASSDEFADLVEWVAPVAAPRVRPETPASIHGMASVAIAYEAFRRAQVDVMVFEVGCGGRFDLTSFVDTAVAVVTSVGLDHVVSLGPGLEQIAWHKAGIARAGAPLVTGVQGEPLGILAHEAERVGAPLVVVPPAPTAAEANLAVATAAATSALERLGVPVSPSALSAGAGQVRLAARGELMPRVPGGAAVILDGAHNADKLAVALESAFARPGAPPTVAVLGFLGAKVTPDLLRPLAGRFERVIATEPQVLAKTPFPAADLAGMLAQSGCRAEVERDPGAALERALDCATADTTILAVGSFYLAGNLRERWFPKAQVVLQRTSWPQPEPATACYDPPRT